MQEATPVPDADGRCGECGDLLVAPNVPHTKRSCETCGRERFATATAEGLKVEPGAQVVVPAGAIQMSLDPTAPSKMFRPGITWFVQTMLMARAAGGPDNVESALDAYLESADRILKESGLLADLDPKDEQDAETAFERVGKDFQKPESWAMRLGGFVQLAKEALEAGDAAKAAFATQHAALSHCMLAFVQQLEPLVWRGYRTYGVEELKAAITAWQERPPDAKEAYWQGTFAEHNFVLSQLFSTPTVVIRGEAFVGGKRVDNSEGQVTDFLVQNALTGAVGLVEIKTPETKLLGRKYRNGAYAPSAELSGAVAQVQANRDTLVKEFYTQSRGAATFFPYDPACIVIAGSTEQLSAEEQRGSFELFRAGLKHVQVVTFDEVFAQAAALLTLVQRT